MSDEETPFVMMCGCGLPLFECQDENGKRIGVQHRDCDDDDYHLEFYSSLKVKLGDEL